MKNKRYEITRSDNRRYWYISDMLKCSVLCDELGETITFSSYDEAVDYIQNI